MTPSVRLFVIALGFLPRYPPELRGDGTLSARTRRTVIRRYVDQMEFEW